MSTFYLKANNSSPILVQNLLDAAGTPINLTSATVRIHVNTQYNVNVVDAAASVDNVASGTVSYTFDGTITDGNYFYEFEVTYADSSVETFPNSGYNVLVVDRTLA